MTKGMDVSAYQGEIDFSKVKAAGIGFAMIRSGFGASSMDSMFRRNVQGCVQQGIPYGIYHYSYALTVEQARREAEFVLDILREGGYQPGYPVAYDMEDGDGYKREHGMPSDSTLCQMCKVFCDMLAAAGYYACIYSNVSWLNTKLSSPVLDPYDKWIAQWGVSAPTYKKPYGMWQYTSGGSVAGIAGRVDLDYAYKDYPAIMRAEGLNGYPKEEENEVKYQTVEQVPEWGRPTIEKLVAAGALRGDGNGLDLSEDMVRMFVVNDRMGLYPEN